jgi:hypothetical protein
MYKGESAARRRFRGERGVVDGIHGAAAILVKRKNFPSDFRQRCAQEVAQFFWRASNDA